MKEALEKIIRIGQIISATFSVVWLILLFVTLRGREMARKR